MTILPAIDLKDGKCVRLLKGEFDTAHVVAPDAVLTAQSFLDAGAGIIHMVDLDGAKSGVGINYPIIEAVIRETGAKIELGGGIRGMESLEAVFALGVYRAVIGSAAVKNPEFVRDAVALYGERIAVGIDARGGTVRTDGWTADSGRSFIDMAKEMQEMGVCTIIFTDIDKDGALTGPPLESLSALKAAVSCEIIASGGVSSHDDIRELRDAGMDGVIIGKAIYTGDIDLARAVKEAK